MSPRAKQIIIAILAFVLLASLMFAQRMEVARKAEEAGLKPHRVSVPSNSKSCVD